MAVDAKDLSIHEELVVETEIDGASVFLDAFVTNILADELWLATRLPEPRLLRLTEGQPIHLTLNRDGAPIIESAYIRRLGGGGKLGMEKSRVFAVRRPQGVDPVMRRAHVRVDLERSVRIRALGALGTEQMGNGRTINIGAGGVQFLTEMPLVLGAQLRLALVLTSREIVVASGTIVRIEDGDPHTQEPAGEPDRPSRSKIAVRFDKINEADQERITCHILSAHRQRVRGLLVSAQATAEASNAAAAGNGAATAAQMPTQPANPAPVIAPA